MKNENKIIDAEFHSVWDGCYDIESSCKINTETKEVFDIEQEDGSIVDDLDCLDEEYIIINHNYNDKIQVFEKDDEDRTENDYWYEF